jgi:hypothetical protein
MNCFVSIQNTNNQNLTFALTPIAPTRARQSPDWPIESRKALYVDNGLSK